MTQIQVKDLRVGDVLTGSGVTVIRGPQLSARLPNTKVDLVVRGRNGVDRPVVWGKYTRVRVTRP